MWREEKVALLDDVDRSSEETYHEDQRYIKEKKTGRRSEKVSERVNNK